QGRKGARDIVGLAEARRDGRAETDVLRHRAQGGYQGGRLEARDERREIARIHGERIGDEKEVELPAFGDSRAGRHDGPAGVAGPGAVVAPAGRVVAGADPEDAEVHLTF